MVGRLSCWTYSYLLLVSSLEQNSDPRTKITQLPTKSLSACWPSQLIRNVHLCIYRYFLANNLLYMYEVRQFNSWNGPVKAKFAYLCWNTIFFKEAVHFVRCWCHCQKQSWKWHSGILCSNVVMLHWMSGMSANLCPFRPFFNFGKSKNLKGAKSGE
jgi:hypothetical protein